MSVYGTAYINNENFISNRFKELLIFPSCNNTEFTLKSYDMLSHYYYYINDISLHLKKMVSSYLWRFEIFSQEVQTVKYGERGTSYLGRLSGRQWADIAR